jgi:molybdenum cofactor cytidylyltransferase
MLGVIVLAAGAGSRMGGVAKCLITVEGETLLQRLLRSVHRLAPVQTVLVLGHHAETIRAALLEAPAPLPLTLVHNPEPGDSPASSLRLGLCALKPEVETAMLLLADQPLLGLVDLQRALQTFEERLPVQRIGWPEHGGEPGHPVLLQADLAREWLAQDRAGLRPWALQRPEQVVVWAPGNTHHTQDLDTPEALARLSLDTGQRWILPQAGAKTRQN